MSTTTSSTISLATFLFRRLVQLGVGSVHGVPGDFNLTMLDHVEPTGLRWVGSANELNAGYAADGYARIKGIGALVTTFGVGELSALNAIAGAYAEHAPVVHIVGVPTRSYIDGRMLCHHTFNDGEYGRYAEMYRHVVVAMEMLRDPTTVAAQVDSALRQCLMHKRPVYIQIPVDLVETPVQVQELGSRITVPRLPRGTSQWSEAVSKLLEAIDSAERPIIYVDGEVRLMEGAAGEVMTLVESFGWPTWSSGYGKGIVNEALPNYHGIYRGKYDAVEVQSFIGDADLVLCFGPHFSSTNTFLFSSIPDPKRTISFTGTEIRFPRKTLRDVTVADVLAQILKEVDREKAKAKYKEYPKLPKDSLIPYSAVPSTEAITQDRFFRVFGNFLRSDDILFGETGTAGYGIRDILLPPRTTFFTPVTWLSIGYMLPAAQGAALAQRELVALSEPDSTSSSGRTVLLIGDGSFQMTAQELSTIIHNKLDVVLVVLNNDGYTIERCIHGANQRYNDVAPWRYLEAPSFFGAGPDTCSYKGHVGTWAELEEALKDPAVADGKGLRMIEVKLGREDAPPGPLVQYLQKQKERMKT